MIAPPLRHCDAHRHHREFLAYLAAMPEVLAIEREALPTVTAAVA